MDLDLQKQLYEATSPEPLTLEDPRFVDLDPLRDGVMGTLADELTLTPKPQVHFVTALPGAGLTTELCALSRRLRDDGMRVVYVDAAEVLDLHEPIDIADLLIVSLAESIETAEGELPALQRLLRWLGRSNVEVDLSAVKLRDEPAARDQLRASLSRLRGDLFQRLREDLHRLVEETRALGYRQIVWIIDSLTRLSSPVEPWEAIRAATRALNALQSLRAPLHIVCSAPAAVLFQQPWPDMHRVSAIPVASHDGASLERGTEAMLRVLSHRHPDIDALFDFSDPRRLVAASGGELRAFMHMLRRVVVRGGGPEAIEAAAKRESESRSYALRAKTRAWLRDVGERHELTAPAHPSWLQAGLVAWYPSGAVIHPLVASRLD